MQKSYKTTEELNKVLTKEYLVETQKLPAAEIARRIGCGSSTIISRRKKCGVIVKNTKSLEELEREKILTKEFLYQKYIIEKLSCSKISKIVNCHAEVIRNYLMKLGIPRRTQAESVKGREMPPMAEGTKQKISKTKKGCSSPNKNRKFSEETKEKMRKAHLGKKLGPLSEETKLKLSKMIKGRPKPEGFGEKISKSYLTSNKQKLKKKFNKKYIEGNYTSIKNNCDIWFDSSYELRAYIKLEKDSQVKSYKRCSFGIPYLRNNKIHSYIPDLEIEYVNGGRAILEVKPTYYLGELRGKQEAAEKYCKERGWQYVIWTEKDIEKIPEIKSQSEANILIGEEKINV